VEENKESRKPESDATELLKSVARQFLTVLLTAGSLVGFVAFAGGVIVWTRFYAAQVPPDQAVNAVPRDELVSIGASMLLLFGFFGALAMLTMYLLDRGGRATPGMSRGLLGLLLAEGVVVISLVDRPLWQRVLAGLAFALPIGVAIMATFAEEFVLFKDKLPSRDDEDFRPRREGDRLSWMDDNPDDKSKQKEKESAPKEKRSPRRYIVLALCLLGLVAVALISSSETIQIVALFLAILLFVAYTAHPVWKYRRKASKELREHSKKQEEESPGAEEKGDREKERLQKRRPFRLVFRGWGMTLFAVLMILAAGGPSLLLGKVWLLASLAAAMILIAGLWRISVLSTSGFVWFGLAVFLSVPLFGTLTAMAVNIDDPQAQPMALIRNTDGPDEAIQGLYVTETDSRVYFATLSTQGCGDKIVAHSGRLLWVPLSEVVAMSVGPSQDVADARTTALEMAYALTPAVETPAGDHVSLTTAEKRAEAAKPAKAAGGGEDQRLENVGAAVRPDFGVGLRLVPEDASAGDIVTLRMSRPNAHVEGFGRAREGRTLRLGGVPVPIVREKVHAAEEAEFVKTADGKILALDKEGVYVRGSGGLVPLADDPDSASRRFVKLADDSGVREPSVGGANPGVYLEVEAKDETRLAEDQQVRFAKGDPVLVEPRLLRQAWHESHIKFRVPENASTGVVSVECEQLAGQPLLRVAQPPVARIAARMTPGSPRVVFDSSRSSGGRGKIVSRRWTIEGLRGAHSDRVAADLPLRPDDYAIGLTVSNAEGQSDTAWLHILRLPADLMRFEDGRSSHPDAMQRAREDLLGVVSRDSPVAVEFDAVPTGAGSFGPGLALRGAEAMRESLLHAKTDSPVDPDLTVRTLAYDRACPFEEGEGAAGGVDIATLSGGVQVVPPRVCPPDRVRIAHGWPPSQP
jgi:MFS family permease